MVKSLELILEESKRNQLIFRLRFIINECKFYMSIASLDKEEIYKAQEAAMIKIQAEALLWELDPSSRKKPMFSSIDECMRYCYG